MFVFARTRMRYTQKEQPSLSSYKNEVMIVIGYPHDFVLHVSSCVFCALDLLLDTHPLQTGLLLQ